MNYRHAFHAGNFADVLKHYVLIRLVRGLQRKEKPLFMLDTHAGAGAYDLRHAARGDTLERQPEWPHGIGRFRAGEVLPPGLAEYVGLVHEFNREHGGGAGETWRAYPGSPEIFAHLRRPQDRLAFVERHPEEAALLEQQFRGAPRTQVHRLDGYHALKALLPPVERRALVLIDPPYEATDEIARIVAGLTAALRRLPAATIAVWYPLTTRAGGERLEQALVALSLPPAWAVEVDVWGGQGEVKMPGCGVLVLNPPWRLDLEIEPELPALVRHLARAPGAAARLRWVVPES
jgi:23S rRNA (adenine2030-N6)-methyltransferase